MLATVEINHDQHISFTQSCLTDAVSVILSELLSYEHPPKSGGIFLWIPYRRGSVPAQVIPQIGRFLPPILMKHQSGETATGFFKKF